MKTLSFGICLALLVSVQVLAEEPIPYQVEVLSKTGSSWNGKALPQYPSGKPEVTILRITIPPGVELPMHRHPVINGGVMLRGQLTVTTEAGRTLHLKSGDPIVEVVDTWHYGKNEGAEAAELIVFYAGVRGSPITVIKERSSAPTDH